MRVLSAAIVVASFQHWLHLYELHQCVKAFVIGPGVSSHDGPLCTDHLITVAWEAHSIGICHINKAVGRLSLIVLNGMVLVLSRPHRMVQNDYILKMMFVARTRLVVI